MKHFSIFQSKLKNITLLVIIGLVLSCFGFSDGSNSITNFYYYKGKPFYLNLKSDVVYVKLSENVTPESFNHILATFTEVNKSSVFNIKDKKDFIRLNTNLDEKSIRDLVGRLNNTEGVEYSSPAFSPDEGKTLIGSENEIIVQFKPDIDKIQIGEFARQKGLEQIKTISLTRGSSYIFKVNKNEFAIDVANEVFNSGIVNWSEPNLFFTNLTCYIPNDPFFPRQWSIRNLGNNIPTGISGTAGCDMRVDSAWNISLGAPFVKVAINDTGCDTLHEDLAANFIPGTGYNFYNNTPGGFDDYGHGTSCAGIVGAIENNNIGISGIAPNTKLMPVKWMNSSGGGNYTGATNAIVYCYQQGAWIISNSWGFVGGASSAMDQAITDCVNLGRNGKGTLFVVAAGNENGAMRYPASTHPSVLVVGGISPCNQRKSPSSCDGENWWGASYGSNLDIVAPCVKIYATDMTNGGFTPTAYDSVFNGTSSATPNTAGACALALALDSTMRWDSLRVRVGRTADRVGSYTYNQPGPRNIGQWNTEMGYGKVNAYRLLQNTLQMMGPMISHTPLTNTEQTNGPRAVNAVITPANAPIVTSLTKLFYAKGTGAYDSAQMTNPSGNNWTGNITLNGAGTYKYYIRTCDNTNKTAFAPIGAPSNFYSFIASTDVTPPVIVTTPLGNIPKGQWPVTVNATATDNIGIDSVWVKWYKNTPSTLKQFKLLYVSGNSYSAPFNSLNSDVNINDSIFYRVFVQDAGSNHLKDSTALIKFKIIQLSNVCIGTGTTSSNFPFTTYWDDGRTDLLYLASEITGGGGYAAFINKIAFNVISVGGPAMNGFNIKMQTTTATSLTAFTNTGWTVCYNGVHTVTSPGWDTIGLTAPFAWNGTSNLLVEICYNNTTYTDYSPVYASTTSANMMAAYSTDLISGDGCTAAWTADVYNYRPNTCFTITPLSGAGNNSSLIPGTYSISQNYPNPFNPVTQIKYDLPKEGFVTLKVYDVLGREVSKLVNEVKTPGSYIVDFDGTSFSSGVYFYRLEVNGFSDVKRMMLIK